MAYLKPELFVIASAPTAIASGDGGRDGGGPEKNEWVRDGVILLRSSTAAYEADE